MVYDLLENIDSWKQTGAKYSRTDPNRSFWQVWKPKRITMDILEKTVEGMTYRVGYHNDGVHILAESLSDFPCTK